MATCHFQRYEVDGITGAAHETCITNMMRFWLSRDGYGRVDAIQRGILTDDIAHLAWTTLTDPLIRQNPVTLQILGDLFGTTVMTLATAVTMSVSLTIVLTLTAGYQ
jgi:hypothetical protein